MNTQASSMRHAALFTLALSLPTGLAAQQLPVTGQMMDGQQANTTVAQSVTPSATASTNTPNASAAPASQTGASTSTNMASASAQTEQPRAVASVDAAAQPGDATRNLLQLQLDGSAAGKHLPMLGNEASASYHRYMDSFNHPIPEFYETAIQKHADNGR